MYALAKNLLLVVGLLVCGWLLGRYFAGGPPGLPEDPSEFPDEWERHPYPADAGAPDKASTAPQRPLPLAIMADVPRTWKRTRAQGVQLARMGVNEDSRSLRREPRGTEGQPTIDHHLIAQVVWTNRRAKPGFRGWLDVMRWLSPHVGKLKDPKRHRHDVSAHLPARGEHPPPQWIDCRDVEEGERCDGDWRVHGPYWVETRERVVKIWMNTDFAEVERNNRIRPRKWGNDDDVIRFLKRYPKSLCVLAMGERNFFLARPGEGCRLNDAATIAARRGKRP